MKVARVSKEEIESVFEFVSVVELFFEKDKFSVFNSLNRWKELDDEDEQKQTILEIQQAIANEQEIEPEDVNEYELAARVIEHYFNNVRSLRHLVFSFTVLDSNCTNPAANCYEFSPYIQFLPTDGDQ